MNPEQAVGQRIRERRELLGMTQGALGEALGDHLPKAWSRQAVHAAETGQRSFALADLIALANALGVDTRELIPSPSTTIDQLSAVREAALRELAATEQRSAQLRKEIRELSARMENERG